MPGGKPHISGTLHFCSPNGIPKDRPLVESYHQQGAWWPCRGPGTGATLGSFALGRAVEWGQGPGTKNVPDLVWQRLGCGGECWQPCHHLLLGTSLCQVCQGKGHKGTTQHAHQSDGQRLSVREALGWKQRNQLCLIPPPSPTQPQSQLSPLQEERTAPCRNPCPHSSL